MPCCSGGSSRAPTHTSGPRCSKLGGRWPLLFHTLVLAGLSWMCAKCRTQNYIQNFGNQKFNPKMKENKLWASENRSPTERRQCKLVSKLKKFLIEHDKQDPKNVIVSYKWFHVRVRNGRTFAHVATVSEDGELQWAEDIGQVSATVKECMAQFEANME